MLLRITRMKTVLKFNASVGLVPVFVLATFTATEGVLIVTPHFTGRHEPAGTETCIHVFY